MKLTVDEVQDKVSQCEEERADYVTLAERWEKMWQGQAYSRATIAELTKDGGEAISLPTPYNTVNLAQRLVASRPKIEVPAREPTAEGEEHASVKQRWLTAMWQQVNKQRGENVTDNASWQTFVRGRHVYEVKWIKDALPKAMRETGFPILIRNLDPLSVGVQKGPLFTEYAFHKYEVELWQVVQRYPEIKNKKVMRERKGGRKGEDWRTETVEMVDFWYTGMEGDVWNAVLMDEEFIKQPEATDYPIIPIVEGYGDTSMSGNAAYKALALLFPLDGLWQYQCRMFSQMATGLLWYFWPFVYITNDQGQIIPDIKVRPGVTESLPPGSTVNVVKIEPNYQVSQLVSAQLEANIQQSTFAGVMYGQAPGDLQAGYGVQLLADAAKGRVRQALSNMEASIETVNQIVLGLVDKIAGKKGVEIWGKSTRSDKIYRECLYPKQINGYFENLVTLKPQMPEDDAARVTLWIRMVEAGLVSKRTFLDKIGYDFPLDEANRVALEKTMEMPEMLPKTALAALMAYYPEGREDENGRKLDSWREKIAGTPLEQVAMQEEQARMAREEPPEGMHQMPDGSMMPDQMMMGGGMPPGMMPPQGMPPQGMPPPGMPPQGAQQPLPPGMMPPTMQGAMPPGMPPMGMPQEMMPPPIQPPALPLPQGGGLPPEMGAQLSPELMGMGPNVDPAMWAQLTGQPMTPEEELMYLQQQGGL